MDIKIFPTPPPVSNAYNTLGMWAEPRKSKTPNEDTLPTFFFPGKSLRISQTFGVFYPGLLLCYAGFLQWRLCRIASFLHRSHLEGTEEIPSCTGLLPFLCRMECFLHRIHWKRHSAAQNLAAPVNNNRLQTERDKLGSFLHGKAEGSISGESRYSETWKMAMNKKLYKQVKCIDLVLLQEWIKRGEMWGNCCDDIEPGDLCPDCHHGPRISIIKCKTGQVILGGGGTLQFCKSHSQHGQTDWGILVLAIWKISGWTSGDCFIFRAILFIQHKLHQVLRDLLWV